MVALVGCSRNQNSLPVGDTSRNSLDWQGVYHGVLPCADCAGILAMIELNENNTYTLSTSYIGKNNAGLKKSGDFTWNDAGGEITLNGLNDSIPPVYKVGENRLIPMNPSVDKARRDQYLLTRNNPDITNKYWQLVRINDNEVPSTNQQRRKAHLILFSPDSTAFGNGSCNSFRGKYKLDTNNALSFSPMAATKMACMESMDIENQFLKILSEVNAYQVAADSLTLYTDQKNESLTFSLTHFN